MTEPITDEDVRVAFGLMRHALRGVEERTQRGGEAYAVMVEAVAAIDPERLTGVLAAVTLAAALAHRVAWPEPGKADAMLVAVMSDWLA